MPHLDASLRTLSLESSRPLPLLHPVADAGLGVDVGGVVGVVSQLVAKVLDEGAHRTRVAGVPRPPQREYGSVLLGSFNVRKLGSSRSRNADTWEFLADVCRRFDLLAVQEIMDDLSGLRRLMSLLGPEFSLVVSDLTGVFPGEPGLGERLGFIYRWNTLERMEVASDVTYDRSKVIDSIAGNYEAFTGDLVVQHVCTDG